MPIIVMIITLTGSYGYTGGGPVIQGFSSIKACEKAIPLIHGVYAGKAEQIRCIAIPNGS